MCKIIDFLAQMKWAAYFLEKLIEFVNVYTRDLLSNSTPGNLCFSKFDVI